jgi:hypothetical protein
MLSTTKVKDSNLVIYVPDGTKDKLPAVIFIPGIGEQNTDVSGLYKNGPLNFIQSGWKPDFIVAGIQPPGQWPSAQWVDDMIKAILASYPVNEKAICLTGLSAGAATIYGYIQAAGSITSFVKPASIIAFSFPPSDTTGWKDLPAWGLCGDMDDQRSTYNMFPGQYGFWNNMQNQGWKDKPWTTMVGYGHNGWNDFYDPKYVDKALKLSLYDWMKKFAAMVQLTPAPVSPLIQPSVQLIPLSIGRIEAENFTYMSGVQTENTTDAGSGKNVGYIDKGDWMEYLLDIPQDGKYKIDFRIATPNADAMFQVFNGAEILATVGLPSTGGYQNWQTVSIELQLKKGIQSIRLVSQGTPWNINWINIAPVISGKKLKTVINIYDDQSVEVINK